MTKKPVVIEIKAKTAKTTPVDADPVPELDIPLQQTKLVQAVTGLSARKPKRMARLFLWVIVTLIGFVISVAFWDFVAGLMVRNLWLGRVALGLTVLFVICILFFILRELAAFARLRRMDKMRTLANAAHASQNLKEAQAYSKQLERFYRDRRDVRWGFATVQDQSVDILDADTYMGLLENTVVKPLDKQAMTQIEAASRQVATATALIPLAFADVLVALMTNLRMIRRISEIYGGRSGVLGSWRLLRAVIIHLVATGAVAIGDDMIGTIAGGSVMSKLSRRFGEGIINGALTARVGVAAMEVCRPMPFKAVKKPSLTGMMKRALTGFWS